MRLPNSLGGRFIDNRRLLPMAVIIAFMAVTVGHVANFTGSFELGVWRILGWPYAFAVDTAILVCNQFTKWKTTQKWAWGGFFAFTLASGAMNVAAVQPWLHTPQWAAWVYAMFPTMAISLLGFLYGQVDKLVQSRERTRGSAKENTPKAPKKWTLPTNSGSPSEALSKLKALYPGLSKYPTIREVAEMQAKERKVNV